MEKTIKISNGEVVLSKPKAGVRNNAALASYQKGQVNEVKFMIELLPFCVKKHPWGTVPVKQALDSLEIEEYDKLVDALKEFMGVGQGDVKKKLEKPSAQKDAVTAGS